MLQDIHLCAVQRRSELRAKLPDTIHIAVYRLQPFCTPTGNSAISITMPNKLLSRKIPHPGYLCSIVYVKLMVVSSP